MELKLATKKQVKLRLGLSAVSGGGKTMSALLLAKGLVGDWSKIAVIDTENESASLYSHLGAYYTIPLSAPYTPERYIQAIKTCEDAGIECIVIDSITHEWDGKGGILEIHGAMSGNSFTNWSAVTPRHSKFIEAILQSKCHVITTVRRKQDYEMTVNDKGKQTPVKVGLKEITREGFEYELTINFNLDDKHQCTASKDRTNLFMDQPSFVITEETGEAIKQWCDTGEKIKTEAELVELACVALNTSTTLDELSTNWKAIGKSMQEIPAVLKLKDELKVKFTPQTNPA
jgi:hypothetical protein